MSSEVSVIPTSEGRLPGWSPVIERRRACQLEPARRLMAETDRRMLVPARRIGCDLQPLGVSRLPAARINETRYTETGPWKIVDYRDDPTRDDGDMLIPVDVLSRLEELDRANVRPQFLVVGHQLPPDWHEGQPIPPVPSPRHLREKDQLLTQRLEFGSKLLFGALGGLLVVAMSPLALGAAVVAGAGLDPIFLGGVKHPELPLVEWCCICGWEWE